jgi:predicted acylesterase/phospholipase RssA
MTRGLALSGGGARGSFQMGALDCLYTVFRYRPQVIAGTSVGSVNGILLAQAENDDEALAQVRKLRGVWDSLTGPGDFYAVRDWVARLTRSTSLDLGTGVHIRLEDAIIQFIFENLWTNIQKTTSLAVLDPLEARMRAPEMFDAAKLARGVPLRMACVSLESGRIRYATEDGRFLERDNQTPVASALEPGPALQEQKVDFTTAVTAVRTLVEAIEYQKDHGDHDTKWHTIARLKLNLERARWRAETAYDRLAAANAARAMPVQARIDPVAAALASAAIPGIFEARQIGAEHYVDGGVREIVPVRATVQLGATEVVAIVCSTQNLPRAGYAGAQSFLDNLVSSLTTITLKEVVDDDLTDPGVDGIPVTLIIPNFDVHDTAVVDTGLIHVSMDYGYMRAADVLSSLSDAERRDAIVLSDAISRLRAETHREAQLWNRPLESGSHQTLEVLRLRKWMIRKLVEARIASGVALPRFATIWFQFWEQGSSSVPNEPNPWMEFTTFAETTPAIEPYAYVPDGWTYEEAGDLDGRYLLRAGARFRGTTEAILAVTGRHVSPVLTVPAGTSQHLPSVPVPGTVLAEQASPSLPATPGTWYVDGKRRYLLNAAALAALGNPAVISVPAGGLAQIPDGGTPYFIGGLAIVNTRGDALDVWDPTPQVEGTRTSTGVSLRNRSARGPITVSDVRITTAPDTSAGTVFRVRTAMPVIVADNATVDLDVEFRAPSPGPLAGVVEIDCDDSIAPTIRLPVATSVLPIGAHAELTMDPDELTLPPTRVGTTRFGSVSVSNTGSRDGDLVGVAILDEQPPGQFVVSEFGFEQVLQPGHETSISLSYTPTRRGPARATFALDLVSATDQPNVTYRRRYQIPMTASAQMPTIFLARGSRSGPIPPSPPDPDPDAPVLVGPLAPNPPPSVNREAELTLLDFGLAPVGEVVVQSLWLRNVGDEVLTVGLLQPYDLSRLFVANPASFPAALPPDGELEAPLQYSSGFVPGLRSQSELHIHSDDPLRPEVVLRVAIQAAGPHFAEPPEAIDLGLVTSGDGTVLTFTSDGSEPVSVSEVGLNLGQDFTITGLPTLPTQVAPGSTLTLAVAVIATAPGPYQDRLVVHHDGNRSRRSAILLRATIA